jgi:hypothetical protein
MLKTLSHLGAKRIAKTISKGRNESDLRYAVETKKFDVEERELQKRCPHKEVIYCMGTPYDNSVWECHVCGKCLREKPARSKEL